MSFDILIRGGLVVDGSGAKGEVRDVGIVGDRIVAVEPRLSGDAKVTVDAAGLTVSPGFIDTHTHSDVMLLADPQHEKALRQGVTTEILGQDGLSYAPLSPENLRLYRAYLAGLNGDPEIDWDWSSVAEYRERFDRTVSINTAWLVPHGAIRLETLGMVDRPLVGEALQRAKRLVERALEEGAVGFSTGLSYFPCSWSDTAELIELCRVAADFGRPFVTHIRTVFRSPQADYHQAAVDETIEIGRRSGVGVHFSHFRTSPRTAGQVDRLLAPIDRAIAQGVDITLETYPYGYGSGFPVYYLPPWVHEGGPEAVLRRLADPKQSSRIRDEIASSPFRPDPNGSYTYVGESRFQWAVGKTFKDVGETLGVHWLDALLQLMVECRLKVGMRGAPPAGKVEEELERDFLQLIEHPRYMVGSDAIHVGERPHPRAYGTFPRYFRLARKHGHPSLETRIQRMTALPAQRFGLTDRGQIAPGKAADIVVFDHEEFRDLATYDNPRVMATGVVHVIVNGRFALKDHEVTGVKAGRSLPA